MAIFRATADIRLVEHVKITNPQAYKRMRDARARLCFYKTYFGVALWALKFVEVPDLIKTAGAPLAADQFWRVYYDPEFVLKCSLKVMMAGLLHELGHLVRGHHDRAVHQGIAPINHRAWNVAGDEELNDDLENDPEIDMKGMPWPYVTPEKMGQPNGKLAEWYYQQLPKKGFPDNSNCGSCVSGNKQAWEHGTGEGTSPRIGKAEGKLIQKHVAEAVKREIKKSRGTISASWERWADEFGVPVINWRQQLSALVRNRCAQVYGNFDYSYAKPNRRSSLYSGIVMPAMVQPVPKVATVIDTSGSMSEKDLGMCMTEIKGILEAVGIGETYTYVCDAEAHNGRRINNIKDIQLIGGGGTDMRVGIQAAVDAHHGDLDVIIVLTDGYTPWPAHDIPRTKLIAILTQKESMSDVPEFIKAVCIDG